MAGVAVTSERTEIVPFRMSGERYDRIVATGALADVRVELIDGIIAQVTPQGAEHADLIKRLMRHLGSRLDLLEVQLPLAAAMTWRPEPDLALVEERPLHEHAPTALLVVEVAVSQWREAVRKLPGYAAAGIPIVWLVNHPTRAVHVITHPDGERYTREDVITAPRSVPSPVEGVGELAVAALFAGF